MGRVQDAVTAALAAEISSRVEWDERPGLYSVGYEGGKAFTREVPLPGALWPSAPPALVLAAIADRARGERSDRRG